MVFGIALNIDYFEKDNYLLVFAIVASMLLIFTLTYITLFEKYMQLHKENYELLLNKKKEELINEYYNNQKNSIENVRIMYHDLKYYILMSNYDGKYMGEIKKNLKQFEELFDSGDEILNLILWKKKKEALSYGIDFKCFAESLDLSFINSIDICFIMGNVLDNAIEAGKEVLKKEECIIVIKIAQINDLIMFKIVNDCIGASRVRLKDGTFSTTKEIKKLHGIGLHSVLRVVKKYDGNCEFRVAEDKFITEILIPCPIKQ